MHFSFHGLTSLHLDPKRAVRIPLHHGTVYVCGIENKVRLRATLELIMYSSTVIRFAIHTRACYTQPTCSTLVSTAFVCGSNSDSLASWLLKACTRDSSDAEAQSQHGIRALAPSIKATVSILSGVHCYCVLWRGMRRMSRAPSSSGACLETKSSNTLPVQYPRR